MAKSTIKIKQEQALEREQKLKDHLKQRTEDLLQNQKKKAHTLQSMEEKLVDFALPLKVTPVRDMATFNRSFKTSDEGKIMTSVASHMYGRYKAPQFLADGWNFFLNESQTAENNHRYAWQTARAAKIKEPSKTDVRLMCGWYLVVASGGSLWKEHTRYVQVGNDTVPAFTRQENHYFLNCTIKNATIREAIIYAIAKNFTSDLGVINRICKTKLVDMPTNITNPLAFFTRPLWRQTIEFFCENQVTVAQINDLLDYIQHAGANVNFTLKGKTITSLTKAMKDWHYELARVKRMGNADWTKTAVQIDDADDLVTEMNGRKIKWAMRQITTSKALAAEGTAMRHCVYSYQARCIEGRTAIWSLQRFNEQMHHWDRALTIEMNAHIGELVQIRGIANRAARNEEMAAVRDWANKNNVAISRYC